jgi:hypothetical protein
MDVRDFVRRFAPNRELEITSQLKGLVESAVFDMREDYSGSASSNAPVGSGMASDGPSAAIFRDVDD